MRSAKAPTISAGVMAAKVTWKTTKSSSGMTTPLLKVAADRVRRDALQEQLVEAAEERVALGEGHAVAVDHPQHRRSARRSTNTCISTDSMFLRAHQAAVEQRQAGDGHQDDQRGGDRASRRCRPCSASGRLRPRQPARLRPRRQPRRAARLQPRRGLGAAACRRHRPAPPKPTAPTQGEQHARSLFMMSAPYSASAPVSPVRMRTTCSRSKTKILPSPILPVLADFSMASIDLLEQVVLDRRPRSSPWAGNRPRIRRRGTARCGPSAGRSP